MFMSLPMGGTKTMYDIISIMFRVNVHYVTYVYLIRYLYLKYTCLSVTEKFSTFSSKFPNHTHFEKNLNLPLIYSTLLV